MVYANPSALWLHSMKAPLPGASLVVIELHASKASLHCRRIILRKRKIPSLYEDRLNALPPPLNEKIK
jgi:hypothetical protein